MGDVTHLPRPTTLGHNAAGRRDMVALVRSFPTLERAECMDVYGEFDAVAFDRWAHRHVHVDAGMHAARFILAVWNGDGRWKVGRFEAMSALASWDRAHRAVFATWSAEPWWP